MGGSVPLYMIDEILHAPTITVPIANHDNNQHSFNENLRIQNAAEDLERICERIERDNLEASRSVAQTIYGGCARLHGQRPTDLHQG